MKKPPMFIVSRHARRPGTASDPASPGAGDEKSYVPFGDAQFSRLEWQQPRRLRQHFELRSERGLLLTLGTADMWGKHWVARGDRLAWDLRSRWIGAVAVTAQSSDALLLDFRPGWWRNGRVATAAGESLRWRLASLRAFQLETEEGSPLLTLRRLGWFRFQSSLELSEAARSRPDVAPLAALTLQLVLAARRHTH